MTTRARARAAGAAAAAPAEPSDGPAGAVRRSASVRPSRQRHCCPASRARPPQRTATRPRSRSARGTPARTPEGALDSMPQVCSRPVRGALGAIVIAFRHVCVACCGIEATLVSPACSFLQAKGTTVHSATMQWRRQPRHQGGRVSGKCHGKQSQHSRPRPGDEVAGCGRRGAVRAAAGRTPLPVQCSRTRGEGGSPVPLQRLPVFLALGAPAPLGLAVVQAGARSWPNLT